MLIYLVLWNFQPYLTVLLSLKQTPIASSFDQIPMCKLSYVFFFLGQTTSWPNTVSWSVTNHYKSVVMTVCYCKRNNFLWKHTSLLCSLKKQVNHNFIELSQCFPLTGNKQRHTALQHHPRHYWRWCYLPSDDSISQLAHIENNVGTLKCSLWRSPAI